MTRINSENKEYLNDKLFLAYSHTPSTSELPNSLIYYLCHSFFVGSTPTSDNTEDLSQYDPGC